ncbi:MAG: 50S ribosomal protein L3 [Thermoprotei archaeon]|nr:MAG: 50S ribosomal protein L3 [Thermoprotei archaeon]
MARRKYSAPRRGSLGVRPRKRASEFVPRIRSWPEVDFAEPKPLAFLGYKAGMTHVIMFDDRPGTRTYGQEVHVPVTVIETPPMIALAARFYIPTVSGLKCLTEVWADPPEELEVWRRVKTLSVSEEHRKRALEKLETHKDEVVRVSLLLASQPKLAGGLSKKVPDIIEVKVGGGDIKSQIEYALNIIGKEIKVTDIFSAGQFIDVIGVTKGKGFQGVIKRFGVKELPRWHKHRKGSRRIGSRSPTIGALSTVPQPGQMGFHRRTELNKRILMIGSDGYSITPAGGFPHYGIVRSDFIVVKGSVQGPPKRPLVLRWPIRPPSWVPEEPPKILYVSLESKI